MNAEQLAAYARLMAEAQAILNSVDARHDAGQSTGDKPIDRAEALLNQAKELRAASPGTTYTAEEAAAAHRAAAAASYQAADESFDRCDTDGFVSQWASSMTGRLHQAQAELLEAGGRITVPALFDTAGNLVPAKLVPGRYGMAWGLLPSDNPHGKFTGWFHPSRARDPQRRRATDAAKGYQVGRVRAPAVAELQGSGTGLSGAASVHVGYRRTDGGFSRDVEVVSASHYPEED